MAARRFLCWTLALTLLPFLWAVVRELVLMVPPVLALGIRAWWLYAFGVVIYFLIERVFAKPMTLYVYGHELTHAVSGLLSGAKIHSMKASSKGGEVRMSKSNLFVALSPYIVPFYTLVVVLLFVLVRIWWKDPLLTHFFQFLIGASLAFHLSMTVSAIHRKQPDLKITGLFLSTVLITTANALILGVFCVSLFKKTPTIKQFSHKVGRETFRVWKSGTLFVKNEIQDQFNSREQVKKNGSA